MSEGDQAQPANPDQSSRRGLLAGLARDPLLHFLLLAVGLFALQWSVGEDERERIVVDAQAQAYLFKQEEELRLRPLTADEKQAIVDSYIEDEILVREARARGFTDSSRIRALLLQNMRFFIGSDVPEPGKQDLRDHFEANKDDFTSPPSLDLNHVVFVDLETVPPNILELLNTAEDPSSLGDPDTRLGFTIRYLDQTRLVGMFGAGPARELLAIGEGDTTWRGPFEAPDGSQHFLRIAKRNAPRTPTFEEAENWIATHWLSAKTRELTDAALGEMRQNYIIDVEPVESGSNG